MVLIKVETPKLVTLSMLHRKTSLLQGWKENEGISEQNKRGSGVDLRKEGKMLTEE